MLAWKRLRQVRDELSQLFVERGDAIDSALTCLLARQHLLLIGPPGTAKSMLAEEICSRIEGAQYFSWLLTKFTTPEEIFGAISLAALEQDEYRRVTTHKLPEAHVAFLDEVFKANSSILNSLLAVMNERRFHNGRAVQSVPLMTLFGATNELPEDDELQALYDRFLVRLVVDYIEEDFHFLRMLAARPQEVRVRLTLEELAALQARVSEIEVPAELFRSMAEIRRALQKKNLIASDRRYRQSVTLLQAHALLRGAERVEEEDLAVLQHVLWRLPAERAEVRAVLHEHLRGYEDEAKALLFRSQELHEYASRPWDNTEQRSRAVLEAHTKIHQILQQLERLILQARERGRPVDRVEAVRAEVERIQQRMLETL